MRYKLRRILRKRKGELHFVKINKNVCAKFVPPLSQNKPKHDFRFSSI